MLKAVFGKLPGVAWVKDVSVNPLEAQYQLPTQILVQVRACMEARTGYRPKEASSESVFWTLKAPYLHEDQLHAVVPHDVSPHT